MPDITVTGKAATRFSWAGIALLLGALWLAGILTRSVWTPDEPREFALSVNMLGQSQWAVPTLAGQPFAEKPPLTYWAAAGAMRLFGVTAPVARLPNLLYGLITVLCTALLAASMVPPQQRRSAAQVAAVVAGTAWLSFLHTIWLASDAPLLAASAIAMLGAWLGPTADSARLRTAGYLLFHLGLALAFLAKNLLGVIAPLMALGLFILWERRWRELLRWQLWLGGLLSLGLVGLWLLAVWRQPDGSRILRVFLWDNSVGRFLPVATTGEYRSGHRNSPGKLVSEVALGLLPWLFAALAAWWFVLRNAWRAAPLTSAARFLAAAALPLIVLLSFSSTVRDVYALPSMVPLTAAIGLWWAQRAGLRSSGGITLVLTRGLLVVLGLVSALLGILIAWLGDGPAMVDGRLLLAGTVATAIWFAAARIAASHSLFRGLGVFAAGLSVFLLLASPIIERGQDLRPTAREALATAAGRPLLLTARDETMAAALEYTAGGRGRLTADITAAARIEPDALALVETDTDRLTPVMRARLTAMSPSLGDVAPLQREADAQRLRTEGWTLLRDFPAPGGRHYQLLRPPSSP